MTTEWDIISNYSIRVICHFNPYTRYIRGVVGIVLVYDITQKTSFDHITKQLEYWDGEYDKDTVIMVYVFLCILSNIFSC